MHVGRMSHIPGDLAVVCHGLPGDDAQALRRRLLLLPLRLVSCSGWQHGCHAGLVQGQGGIWLAAAVLKPCRHGMYIVSRQVPNFWRLDCMPVLVSVIVCNGPGINGKES